MDMILEARGLHYAYAGGVAALDGLDLSVERGRRLAILGPNGAGKTTLLMHLNGTLRPAAGQVLLDGEVQTHGRAALAAWRRRVGLVLQEPDDQLFAPSVAEDVSFGPLNLGLSEDETRARVTEALDSLRIGDLAERPTHMLSFGQKKRAAIAGAVAMRPEVLLLDEPTAGLDQFGAIHLLAVLEKLRTGGATLVFTTHDVDLAWAWADTVALFVNGKVVRQGLPEDVLADTEALAQARLKPPLLLDLGLAARDHGWLPPGARLPRTRAEAMALMENISR